MTELTSPTGNQMPSVVGRYQITGTLGFGAMGAVYKAFDPLIKRTLAIKTIRLDVPRQSPQYASFIERFYREARISGTLSHPNIVTLFDIGEEGGVPFLAMEFVDGRTVAAVIEEGTRFKPENVIALVSQIAAAIDYAHSRGVVHRDIKPSNLILYEEDKVKVTDFGIAKLADSEITHAGVLLGTPSYMSPEQAMGEKLDGRSDIFSLGVCAFEMLSGQQPFPGTNVTSILYKLVHVDPIEPADLETNGLVPDKWREVFHKVLAKKPANRYQTAAAFVQDLEYCLGSWFTGLGEQTLRLPAPGTEPTLTLGAPVPAGLGEATVQLGAAKPADEVATVLMRPASPKPPPDETPTVVVRPAPAAGEPAAEARVVVRAVPPDEAATVVFKPAPAAAAGEDRAPQTLVLPPTSVSSGSAGVGAASRPAQRRAGLGWILGGAAAVALLTATGFALWQRARTTTPAPEASATPSAPVAAGPQPTSSAPAVAQGSIQVETSPAGANVLVDGQPRGQAPLTIGELLPGSYDVRVEQKGYEPQARTVLLSAEAPAARLQIDLARSVAQAGSADILSTPAGAAVSVDGRAAGRTPISGLALRPGSRRLQLALDGHEPWSGTVDVVSGQKARVEVRLRQKAEPVAVATPVAVDPLRIYGEDEVDVKPRKLSGSSPSYPERGLRRLKSGERVSVRVHFVVSETGEVKDPTVVESGVPLLDELVVSAIRSWKFQPATKHGTPVKSRSAFTLTFLGA